MINEIGRGKLLLISTLNKNRHIRPASQLQLEYPLTNRQKLIQHRQFQLNKIRSQISALIQNQIKTSQQQPDASFDINNNWLLNVTPDKKKQSKRYKDDKSRIRSKSIFQDRYIHQNPHQSKQRQRQLDLSDNLIVRNKRILNKQKMQKVESMNLPKIGIENKTNAKFNHFQGKIQGWKFKPEEFGSF